MKIGDHVRINIGGGRKYPNNRTGIVIAYRYGYYLVQIDSCISEFPNDDFLFEKRVSCLLGELVKE